MKMKEFLKSRLPVLLGLTAVFLPLDQWTKHLIHTRFRWGESLPLIDGFFSLTYVRNTGAAFGILSRTPSHLRDPFFILVPIVAVSVIVYFLYKLEGKQKVSTVALSLIFCGAIGNLIDRLRFEFVIDFLDFYYKQWHYPAFNVADSCIVVGVGLWFLTSLRVQKGESKRRVAARGEVRS